VGLVETHSGSNYFPSDAHATMALMQEYAAQVQPLAAHGAQQKGEVQFDLQAISDRQCPVA